VGPGRRQARYRISLDPLLLVIDRCDTLAVARVRDTESLGFDQVVEALCAWVGRSVSVLIGPVEPPDLGPGLVWARLEGTLRQSRSGAEWDAIGSADPERGAVAFQVGDGSESYFVVYRSFFKEAYWLPLRRFLVVRMDQAEVGAALTDVP
jgi:hypothetical protein